MAEELFTLVYNGGDADLHRLSFYDASVSYQGFSRTLAILGHYYATGEIIAQAPHAKVELFIVPPEEGSFKQNVLIGVVSAALSVPFVKFTEAVMDSWFPKNDPQLTQIIDLLKTQNEQLRSGSGQEAADLQEARRFVGEHATEVDVLRSVTSNSFRNIFRPVGRSVKNMAITGGRTREPIGVVTPMTLALIESDWRDPRKVVVTGVVSAFSRNSKTGVIFSKEMERGFRFEFMGAERLQKEDIFSWSQFTQNPIMVEGEFVYFHDGTIKKMLIYHAQPLLGD